MELVSDLVQRLPLKVLLGILGCAILIPPVVAAVAGGSVAVASLLAGVLLLLVTGGLLAFKVHLGRLPLALSTSGIRTRLDGHPAYQFRVQLGRGRTMDSARVKVRFLPDHGAPMEIAPLMDHGQQLLGPWTVVIVDREEHIAGPGAFEVQVEAREGGKHWSARSSYRIDALLEGRFVPAVQPARRGWGSARPRFDAVQTGPEG